MTAHSLSCDAHHLYNILIYLNTTFYKWNTTSGYLSIVREIFFLLILLTAQSPSCKVYHVHETIVFISVQHFTSEIQHERNTCWIVYTRTVGSWLSPQVIPENLCTHKVQLTQLPGQRFFKHYMEMFLFPVEDKTDWQMWWKVHVVLKYTQRKPRSRWIGNISNKLNDTDSY